MVTFSSDPAVAETQMRAVIYYLVAFAYIDSDFDPAEKRFIKEHIARLVEARARAAGHDPKLRGEAIARLTQHFHEVMEEIDHTIAGYFTESVSLGETTQQFVLAKLKLHCFELLKRFDEAGQQALLAAVEELMLADGVIHPSEAAFRDEVVALVHAAEELEPTELEAIAEGSVIIDETKRIPSRVANHPFFASGEWDFAREPVLFEQQSRGELQLVGRLMQTLEAKRARGAGRLAGVKSFGELAPGTSFLDGYVHVLTPDPAAAYELLVLGDLHGCYSCLKAALLQADFFDKVEARRQDPRHHPEMALVLLGDYIDRGKFGLAGTLRAAMQLQVKLPENVYMLRGNHEYYVELDGRVLAPVRPCEAMDSIAKVARPEVFVQYMKLFEALPNVLAVGNLLFVHGGLPRADTLRERWKGLATLNDPDIRFQMMWSDPSEADVVPLDLQKANARFPFGRRQFHEFMGRIGCKTMVRGHERVCEGFRKVYDDPEGILLTLFSAGGAANDDLPPDSGFREVSPKALTIRISNGVSTFVPFEIDYARFNDPRHNAFFREQLGG
ncbi:MAG: metallophosphoesterase [Acidobacteriota bacterium]